MFVMMKKSISCIALLFAVLFALAACNLDGNPILIGEQAVRITLLDDKGSTYVVEVDKKDFKNGTTRKDAETRLVTTAAASKPAFVMPSKVDPADPYIQQENSEIEILSPKPMPTGKVVTVKEKDRLLTSTNDGKTLTGGTFTMKATINMAAEGGQSINLPVTLIRKDNASSLTLSANVNEFASLTGSADDTDNQAALEALNPLLNGKLTFIALDDGSKKYVIFPQFRIYMDGDEMLQGLDMNPNSLSGGDGKKTYVRSTRPELNKKTYTCEEYKNGDTTVKYYFQGNYLKRIETTTAGETILLDVSSIDGKVSANALKLSPLYANANSLAG